MRVDETRQGTKEEAEASSAGDEKIKKKETGEKGKRGKAEQDLLLQEKTQTGGEGSRVLVRL